MYPGLCWVSLSGGSLWKTLQTVLSSDASLSKAACASSHTSVTMADGGNESTKRKRLAEKDWPSCFSFSTCSKVPSSAARISTAAASLRSWSTSCHHWGCNPPKVNVWSANHSACHSNDSHTAARQQTDCKEGQGQPSSTKLINPRSTLPLFHRNISHSPVK